MLEDLYFGLHFCYSARRLASLHGAQQRETATLQDNCSDQGLAAIPEESVFSSS